MKVLNYSKSHPFVLLSISIIVAIILHSTTLSYSPLHWQDEVQINEIAQGGIGEHRSDWSVNIVSKDGTLESQAWVPFYLGGVSSELGYQLFGDIGPRVMALVWLIVATGFLLFYLFKRTGDSLLSSVVAFLFFTTPPLLQSVRGGRVDVMAFAFVFMALVLLQFKKSMLQWGGAILAGVLLSIACFSWISCILVTPLLLWELWDRSSSFKKCLTDGVCFLVGALVTALLLLLPFGTTISHTLSLFTSNFSSNASIETLTLGWHHVHALINELLTIPFTYCVLLLFLCLQPRKFWPLILACGLFCVVCLPRIYVFRTLYLLPYAVVVIGITLGMLHKQVMRQICLSIILLMGLYGYCYSVILRNSLDYFTKEHRDYSQIRCVLEDVIGRKKNVYLATYQLYYVGRSLEWSQFYHPGSNVNGPIPPKLLQHVDYYVVEKDKLSSIQACQLAAEGFRLIQEVGLCVEHTPSAVVRFLEKHGRLRPLGPYLIYCKASLISNSQQEPH